MKKIERLKKERAELDKRIEALEYAERLFEEGDEIYHIDEYGTINSGNWGNYAWVDEAFSQGHIFRTKQEAETETKRRNLLTRFRSFRDECNGNWKPDWDDIDQEKYIIKCEQTNLYIVVYWTMNEFNLFGYFKNGEDAERAIELFGDEIKELFVEGE
nr:MAG TPA: hypothetical protein [Caudoviricetes sp.]